MGNQVTLAGVRAGRHGAVGEVPGVGLFLEELRLARVEYRDATSDERIESAPDHL